VSVNSSPKYRSSWAQVDSCDQRYRTSTLRFGAPDLAAGVHTDLATESRSSAIACVAAPELIAKHTFGSLDPGGE
jgi:hypothetical protein